MFFLTEPVELELVYQTRRIAARAIRDLKNLAADNRAALLEQWTESQADE